jgi:hypothetical protein
VFVSVIFLCLYLYGASGSAATVKNAVNAIVLHSYQYLLVLSAGSATSTVIPEVLSVLSVIPVTSTAITGRPPVLSEIPHLPVPQILTLLTVLPSAVTAVSYVIANVNTTLVWLML